ncbi:MAG: hypothetical protein JO047_03650, partial [Alphaproteobacteria bacterium]|nr:hypothetical protein [Alphaproteobacteria bacterium]
GGIDGEPIREFRTFLPGSVQPGESVAVSLMLELAGIPEGEYLLRLDVVSEQHFWFADQGGNCAWLRLRVGANSLTFVTHGPGPN